MEDNSMIVKKWQQPQQEIDYFEEKQENGTTSLCVPNWLIEVLKWINRIEMAKSSISISCRLFYRLCYSKLHLDVEPHIVDKLGFYRLTNTLKFEKSNFPMDKMEDIPIAEVPPPAYILGFKSIYFGFFDDRVLEFIKNILPLISSRNFIIQGEILPPYCDEMDMPQHLIRRGGRIEPNDLLKLLTMLTNSGVGESAQLRCTCRCISLHAFTFNFPGILDNIQILSLYWASEELTLIDCILNWLMKPRIDGKPKILFYEASREWKVALVNRIKKEFLNSTQPMTFLCMVNIRSINDLKFKMENTQTGEVLQMIKNSENNNNCWYLLRCPIGMENEWKEEGLNLFNSQLDTATTFYMNWKRTTAEYESDISVNSKMAAFSKYFESTKN